MGNESEIKKNNGIIKKPPGGRFLFREYFKNKVRFLKYLMSWRLFVEKLAESIAVRQKLYRQATILLIR